MHHSAGFSCTHFQVVLPVYNESRRIRKTLDHLAKHCSNILVIDNFSTDGTPDLIAKSYSNIKIVKLANCGTTETPQWWHSASAYFTCPYIFFASCSEHAPTRLLELLDSVAAHSLIDLLEIRRKSFTGNLCSDSLYCEPISIFQRNLKPSTVIRLVRWNAINSEIIFPHSTFRNQVNCSRCLIDSSHPDLVLYHFRDPPSFQSVSKNTFYALSYAKAKFQFNPIHAIIDSFLRCILDTARILRSVLTLGFNRTVGIEYALRLLMHFQVAYFSLVCFLKLR